MNVVIIGEPADLHVSEVREELKNLGHRVVVWSGIEVAPESFCLDLKNSTITIGAEKLTHIDVVWFRRMFHEIKFHQDLREEDKEFVNNETSKMFRSALSWLAENTEHAVNDLYAHLNSENKARQIQLASAVGFNVPKTLMSNNYDDVTRFIKETDIVIHKSLTQYTWSGSCRRKNVAAIVDKNKITKFQVESCPSIYQNFIKKAYEVRLVVFGDYFLAVKIFKTDGSLMVDWRPEALGNSLTYEQIELPLSIKKKVNNFMNQLNLMMGVFDFSIDENENWWFLEVNSQGQWLFMQDWISDLNLVKEFCEFLTIKNKASIKN